MFELKIGQFVPKVAKATIGFKNDIFKVAIKVTKHLGATLSSKKICYEGLSKIAQSGQK